MRTTLTLDPDVADRLAEEMRTRGISFKQAVNDALRAALAPEMKRRPYKLQPLHLGEPLVSLEHTNRVVELLEDGELREKLRQGR